MPREILNSVQAAQQPNAAANDFKDRLVKLIPAEIITAYVTIAGLITGFAKVNPDADVTSLLRIVIAILMVFTPFYLYKISGVTKKGQLIFSTIGFVVWAFATASPLSGLVWGFPHELITSVVLILYTLLIPAFYKG